MDYKDKKFDAARRKGWLKREYDPGFKDSFVGAFLRKHPERSSILDIVSETVGHYPMWEDLDDSTMRDLRDEIMERMSQNSAIATFKRLKTVFNEFGKDFGLPSEKYSKILKAKAVPSVNIYLTEKELAVIDSYMPKSETENYVKTCMMISAYTGCRHSDAVRMTEKNIIGGTLHYVSRKTKILVKMPVHRNLMKYLGVVTGMKEMNLAEHNLYIKKICKNCLLNDKVKVFRAGKEVEGEKWEFVTTHTFRRSFATNLYMRGTDLHTIMKLMGHSDIEQTMGYICDEKELSSKTMGFFY